MAHSNDQASPAYKAEDDSEGSNAVATNIQGGSNGKDRRKSAAGRKLMRWDPMVDQQVLLAVEYVISQRKIDFPWNDVAACINDRLTGEAIKQHLVKVYKARVAGGQPVPDKPHGASRPESTKKIKAKENMDSARSALLYYPAQQRKATAGQNLNIGSRGGGSNVTEGVHTNGRGRKKGQAIATARASTEQIDPTTPKIRTDRKRHGDIQSLDMDSADLPSGQKNSPISTPPPKKRKSAVEAFGLRRRTPKNYAEANFDELSTDNDTRDGSIGREHKTVEQSGPFFEFNGNVDNNGQPLVPLDPSVHHSTHNDVAIGIVTDAALSDANGLPDTPYTTGQPNANQTPGYVVDRHPPGFFDPVSRFGVADMDAVFDASPYEHRNSSSYSDPHIFDSSDNILGGSGHGFQYSDQPMQNDVAMFSNSGMDAGSSMDMHAGQIAVLPLSCRSSPTSMATYAPNHDGFAQANSSNDVFSGTGSVLDTVPSFLSESSSPSYEPAYDNGDAYTLASGYAPGIFGNASFMAVPRTGATHYSGEHLDLQDFPHPRTLSSHDFQSLGAETFGLQSDEQFAIMDQLPDSHMHSHGQYSASMSFDGSQQSSADMASIASYKAPSSTLLDYAPGINQYDHADRVMFNELSTQYGLAGADEHINAFDEDLYVTGGQLYV